MIPNANYYAILASRETEKTIPNGNRFTTENKESKMIV
jgi:hypothetical protein